VAQCLSCLYTAGLLLKLSRVDPGRSLDGRPDAAGSGVGRPVGCIPFLWSKIINIYPNAPGDIALCRVPSFGWDFKRVSCLSVVR
jgi:hypothetical protein